MFNLTRLGPFLLRRSSRFPSALVVGALAGIMSVLFGGDPLSAGAAPVTQFTYRPANPSSGQSVQFTDLSSNAPTSWSWSFGDGGTSTLQNPTHVFSAGGSYRVTLIASNASGSSPGAHTVDVSGSRRPVTMTVPGREVAPIALADSISGCDYYAAPAGAGDGLSPGAPFQVADFWSHASPGKTLCLLDGIYDDPQGMISPPAGISGVDGSPITVKALHDGRVLVTGHATRSPVLLVHNDWFVVEGVNACCSSASVVDLEYSSRNVIRRIAAWDAADGNTEIFGVHYGDHNLLEDVAGWGIARKIYQSSQGGDFTTIRRAWGRWEGSHVTGPKMVYTLAYNNYDMLVENSIGTWSGEKMKQTYVLLDYNGHPWTGVGGGTYTNHGVNQPYGIFANDGLAGDRNARARLLGSIAYVAGTDVFKADREVFVTNIDSVEIKDMAAVFASGGTYSGKYTLGLYGLTTNVANGGETNVRALNLTSISADSLGSQIGDGWQRANVFQSQDLTALTTSDSVYPGTEGADLCHEYVDGTLTDRPLWPWPMNGRISEAMVQSGRAPVDVTQTIEQLLGPIPSGCRSADLLVPVAGHVDGVNGALILTDLHIYNPSSATAHAGLLFQPIGADQTYRVSLEIAPGQTVNSRDSVQELLGLGSAVGSLRIQSDANGEEALRVNARVFAVPDAGTMGMAVTSAPISNSPASSSTFVTGLAETEAFHSSLGAVNTTDHPQIFKIVLRSPTGSVLYTSPAITIDPGLPMQWLTRSLFSRANGTGLLAEFQPQGGTTAPFAYGILVDNASGDSTFQPAMAPLSTLYLPAIGNVPGASGVFLTDLSISNTSDSTVTARATFLDHDGSSASPTPASLTLDPHETLRMTDALRTLFGLTQGYGALHLEALDGSSSLLATGRAYTPSPTTGGTMGQQINAVTARDLRAWGSLLGLEQDDASGTNVAFLNPGASGVSVTLELRDSTGSLLASQTLDLPPAGYLQRSLPALFSGVAFPSDAAMTLSFRTSAGAIFAFASIIDKGTGDPTFFSSVP